MMRREGYDSMHYTITRRRRAAARRGNGDVYHKGSKLLRMDGGSEDSDDYDETTNGYTEETEGDEQVRKFNPWQADIHYGLTVNPSDKGG